ncbi:MAG: 16S rRNA (cytidine(1402)-2'-O)-methyltransferase, partial [Slackia sp.]
TKVHEEVRLASAGEVRDEFARRDEEGGVKGEIVLVVGPPTRAEEEGRRADASASAAERAAELVARSELTRKEIVKVLRDEFDIARNEAYDLVMKA